MREGLLVSFPEKKKKNRGLTLLQEEKKEKKGRANYGKL